MSETFLKLQMSEFFDVSSGCDDPAEPEPGPPGVDMDVLEQLAEG